MVMQEDTMSGRHNSAWVTASSRNLCFVSASLRALVNWDRSSIVNPTTSYSRQHIRTPCKISFQENISWGHCPLTLVGFHAVAKCLIDLSLWVDSDSLIGSFASPSRIFLHSCIAYICFFCSIHPSSVLLFSYAGFFRHPGEKRKG